MRGIIRFARECVQELKKVTWPSREEVRVSTRLVVISVAVISMFLGAVDYVLFWLVNILF